MRISLNVPEDLMEEALRITPSRSKTNVVILSLREFIRRRRLDDLRAAKGKVRIDIDLKRSRRR